MTTVLMPQAQQAFGDDAAQTIWQKLKETFGPLVAQIILKWLLAQVGAGQPLATEAQLADSAAIRSWLKVVLTTRKPEILAFVDAQLDQAYDSAVSML